MPSPVLYQKVAYCQKHISPEPISFRMLMLLCLLLLVPIAYSFYVSWRLSSQIVLEFAIQRFELSMDMATTVEFKIKCVTFWNLSWGMLNLLKAIHNSSLPLYTVSFLHSNITPVLKTTVGRLFQRMARTLIVSTSLAASWTALKLSAVLYRMISLSFDLSVAGLVKMRTFINEGGARTKFNINEIAMVKIEAQCPRPIKTSKARCEATKHFPIATLLPHTGDLVSKNSTLLVDYEEPECVGGKLLLLSRSSFDTRRRLYETSKIRHAIMLKRAPRPGPLRLQASRSEKDVAYKEALNRISQMRVTPEQNEEDPEYEDSELSGTDADEEDSWQTSDEENSDENSNSISEISDIDCCSEGEESDVDRMEESDSEQGDSESEEEESGCEEDTDSSEGSGCGDSECSAIDATDGTDDDDSDMYISDCGSSDVTDSEGGDCSEAQW